MAKSKPDYTLSIDLNTLNHLGIGLYSNIPAVVSEVVANAWDADAERVDIDFDLMNRRIIITDDGWGMSKHDINAKFLKVGYSKRNHEKPITPKNRHVMGRKGIGKLSLFSIADTIEVHSVKANLIGPYEKNGFVMKTERIKKAIESGKTNYSPERVDESTIKISKGTQIILSDLKSDIDTTAIWLRKRLARRFSVIGNEYGFTVNVNGDPISVEDRDYFSKIEYLWHIGEGSERYVDYCKNSTRQMYIDGVIDETTGYKITGWVGTFEEQKQIEEGNNTIVVLAWGKLVHEDLLKDLKEGGVFTKYLIGEIRADFMDDDQKEDIATSDRQSLKENDPRFRKLKDYVQSQVLKVIQSKWRDWRNEDAQSKALQNPKVKEWFESLTPDHKKYAKSLFSKIEAMPIPDHSYKKELYKHGILAFETLALTDRLSTLEKFETTNDFEALLSIYADLDALEAVHYYQITKSRVKVLEQFERMLPESKEKAIQLFIFDHLWLLSPTWERASTDARMEERVQKEFGDIDVNLSEDERRGRIDIKYRTAAGKHIIIELKKYNRPIEATELANQANKYRRTLTKCLKTVYPNAISHDIEIICVLGDRPEPHDTDVDNKRALAAYSARYITYDELIQSTRDSYREYLNRQTEIDRIRELINSI